MWLTYTPNYNYIPVLWIQIRYGHKTATYTLQSAQCTAWLARAKTLPCSSTATKFSTPPSGLGRRAHLWHSSDLARPKLEKAHLPAAHSLQHHLIILRNTRSSGGPTSPLPFPDITCLRHILWGTPIISFGSLPVEPLPSSSSAAHHILGVTPFISHHSSAPWTPGWPAASSPGRSHPISHPRPNGFKLAQLARPSILNVSFHLWLSSALFPGWATAIIGLSSPSQLTPSLPTLSSQAPFVPAAKEPPPFFPRNRP